jgi:hypothetical protein
MSASNSPSASRQLQMDYERFIFEAADASDKLKSKAVRGLDRFKSLSAFLRLGDVPSLHSVSDPKISIITFREEGSCDPKDLPNWSTDLDDEIKSGADAKLILVQNISPEVIRILGGQLKIDPQFFSDYIDAMPSIFDVTKYPERKRKDIIPIPWYNIEKVEPSMPMLASQKCESSHIQIRWVGAREYQGGVKHKELKERILPDLTKMNIERNAGLHVPITRNGRSFDHIVLTRHVGSIWFNIKISPVQQGCPQWTRGKLF